MGVDRLQRLDSLLKRVIAESMHAVMQGDAVAPGLITVTGVKCGKDLRDATVGVSVFGDDALKEKAIRHLQHNARKFQAIINREVRMKFTPRLCFKLDLSLEKGDEVLAILDRLPPAND
ncbi:MAG TPA: 30S ribosome-binding factor RbfA [Verrucomicrobia bacterium]|nr:30S ribosome-binding factor RbfA [Verrucomicrobiota bacterium]HCG20113.1 30S ribosome-binding factor RbfA [Verrucomicrobiota bacterium]